MTIVRRSRSCKSMHYSVVLGDCSYIRSLQEWCGACFIVRGESRHSVRHSLVFPTWSLFAYKSCCGMSCIYKSTCMRPFDLPCSLTYSHKEDGKKSIGFRTLQGQGCELSSHSLHHPLPPPLLACMFALCRQREAVSLDFLHGEGDA